MFKLVLEKAEEPEIKLPTSAGSSKKQKPPPNAITLGVRGSTYEFGGGTQTFSL